MQTKTLTTSPEITEEAKFVINKHLKYLALKFVAFFGIANVAILYTAYELVVERAAKSAESAAVNRVESMKSRWDSLSTIATENVGIALQDVGRVKEQIDSINKDILGIEKINTEKLRKNLDLISMSPNQIEDLLATKAISSELDNKLSKLIKNQEHTEAKIIRLKIPTGLVAAFSSSYCPDGWSEYVPAYGRFIRGIDPTGIIDPSGSRQPGSIQEHQISSHSHGGVITTSIGNDGIPNSSYNVGRIGKSTHSATGNNKITTTLNEGGKETRPVNVSLLFCAKD